MAEYTFTVMLEPIDMVRCGECRFYSGEYCKRKKEDEWHPLITKPDDCCIHGKREKNEQISEG